MMSVIFIDDSRLFVKAVEIPCELSEGDVAEYAQNEIESTQLWSADKISSFYKKGNSLCLYVANAENAFDDIDKSVVDGAKIVLPSSVILCALNLDGAVVLESEFSVCAAFFHDNSVKNIASCSVVGDDIATARANAMLIAGIECENPVRYKLASVKVSGSKIVAKLARLDDDGNVVETLSLKEKLSKFATAELRDASMLKDARSSTFRRKFNALVLWCIPLLILAMGAYQIKLISEEKSLAELLAKVNELEPRAKQVEAKRMEIIKLSSFQGEKIHPIETLALINTMRADDIIFDRISQNDVNSVEISGSADSITSVKEFVDAINESEEFSAKMESDTSRGKTRFSIKLTRRQS